MSIKPSRDDLLVIGKYTGDVVTGVGLLMALPLLTALVFAEWDAALDFALSLLLCLAFGSAARLVCRTTRPMGWRHGFVVASSSWIWATVLGALPYHLSGHTGSYVDALFDTMSGLTTTGLYLLQDLDHISMALNMWRHVLTYAGGQGIVVIALTFLFKGTSGAYAVYAGEGKDERLLPHVVHTARAIWLVSLVYLALGWTVLSSVGIALGQSPRTALFDGLWMFMGGWSTGGFAPRSYNAYWYHSLTYELVAAVIFTAGSLNFALHWAVWTGRRSEIRKDIETVSMATTFTLATLVLTGLLARVGVYPDALSLFRKTFYHVLSGHTTTGWMTIYSKHFVTQWGQAGMFVIALVMMIGASAASTAGGIKGLRVGIIVSALAHEMRRTLAPETAVLKQRYHHIKTQIATEPVVRAALLVTLMYVAMYLIAALVGVLCGYDLSSALFEGVSAGSNTGLSCGVTDPSMPTVLKVAYIVFMWLGRLEFMSVFALIGFAVTVVRGR